MAGTRDAYRIARVALTALAVALLASVAITYLIGASKLSTAESQATDGARVLTQENLATYVTGEDLTAPVGVGRAREIDALIAGSILNGEIDAVTIWDPNGTIEYSSDPSLIGTRLPEERFRLREILKSGTASTVQDGMFSTRVPLAPAGTEADAVAQLDRVYAPIWDATAKPWRTASLSLSIALIAILGALYQVSRMTSRSWKAYAGTTFQAFRVRRPAALNGGQGTDPVYAQPDFRKAEEELTRAEVRATTAEERAAALQEQYRKTLEELHAAQTKLEGAALETPSRPDPEIEERLLKAEGRVRLLEGQLQSVKGERDRLASTAQEHPSGTPDPKIEERARAAEAEAIALRAELETAQHEVTGMVKEIETIRKDREKFAARTEDAGQLHAAATAEAAQTKAALETAQAELAAATSELEAAQATVEQLRAAEQRAVESERRVAQLDERARSLEADLAQARQAAEGKIDEAHAAAEARTAEAETRAAQAEAQAVEALAAVAESTDALRSAQESAAVRVQEATELAAAQIRQTQESAAAEVTAAQNEAAATSARMRDIEAAATSDVEAAVAQLQAANARADEAQATLEAANAHAAEMQEALEASQKDIAAARAEAESFRATAGTARAELEDAFRAELESREQELRLDAEAHDAELRRSSEGREAELRGAVEGREAEMQALLERTQSQMQELTERLTDAEGQAQAITAREQQLVGNLEARDHDLAAMGTREAELVAEMAALQAETRELLDAREQELRTTFAGEQTASFGRLQAATEADRVRFETERAEMETREASLRAELDEVRARLEGTSTDLRTTGSELDSTQAELERVRAEADASKVELQTVWSELESAQHELTAAIEQAQTRESELEAVRALAASLEEGTADADGALGQAQQELEQLRLELTDAREDLVRAQGDVQTELTRGAEMGERAEAAERELQEASMRAAAAEHELEQIRHEAEIAASEVASLREIADMQATTAQEREALEEMLRVTQENLNGSNDRATEIQTRADAAEMALSAAREEVEELESRLRQIEMSQAVKAFVREDAEPAAIVAEAPVEVGDAATLEDRRASTPFMQELSLDAKKSLTSILGLSLTLKHKSGPKEQAPLLRQLAAYARRLDHTVADLLDADKLARGEVELHLRRTDLEALVQRVVEESQVGNDHDVRLQTERIIASVDPVRTEQILMGLLRGSTDRTPLGSAITIRLTKGQGGALISVEDAEASSDASLSPVVARFADIQGGWAKVESRPNGGSAFRVFLPDESIMPDAPAEGADPEIELTVSPRRTDLEIVVSDELDQERQLVAAAADDDDPWAAGQLLVEELQKLSRDD